MELWFIKRQECSAIDLRSKDNPRRPPHRRECNNIVSMGKVPASVSEREDRATVQISIFAKYPTKSSIFLNPSQTLIESEKAVCTSRLEKQPLTSMFAINFGLKAAFQLSWSPLSFLLVCCRLPPFQTTHNM